MLGNTIKFLQQAKCILPEWLVDAYRRSVRPIDLPPELPVLSLEKKETKTVSAVITNSRIMTATSMMSPGPTWVWRGFDYDGSGESYRKSPDWDWKPPEPVKKIEYNLPEVDGTERKFRD